MNRLVAVVLLLVVVLGVAPVTASHPLTLPTPSIVPSLQTSNGYIVGSSVIFGPVVLTARHVLSVAKSKIYVVVGEQVFPAEVSCAGATEIDFAVLLAAVRPSAIRGAVQIPAVGETVWVAGYPNGRWAVRAARVVGIEERVVVTTKDGRQEIVLRVLTLEDPTKTVSRPGISGGGVFTATGELIGIVCCIRESVGGVSAVPLVDGLTACVKQ